MTVAVPSTRTRKPSSSGRWRSALSGLTCALAGACLVALDATGAAAVEAAPAPVVARQMPVYASMPDPTAAEIKERIDLGWATGAFMYYPPDVEFGWTSRWTDLDRTFPRGVDLFVSPKDWTRSSLRGWARKLSPEQREKTTFAYWQEPEQEFTTDQERREFRRRVTKAAEIVQPFGIRNGIHLQSWTLNEANHNSWGGRKNFKAFIPKDRSTVDFVGISLYDEHQNYSGPEQLKPVVKVLRNQVPKAEWGPVASGWSVPNGTPDGHDMRDERTPAADDGLDHAIRKGATEIGWFDFADWEGRDYGVATDSKLLKMLRRY